ncbi:MAG: hypothetical protein AAGH15_28365 [Myxococcota bacterium]
MLAYVGSGTLHLDEGRRLGRPPMSGFFASWIELHRSLARADRAGELGVRPPGELRLRIPLRDLRVVSALPEWPSFEVCWRAGAGLRRETFAPPAPIFGAPEPEHAQRHESVVRALFADLQARGLRSLRLARGWTTHEDVAWEPAAGLPLAGPRTVGGYRVPAGSAVVAARSPGRLASLRDWLSSSPERPWGTMAREVVLTATHVYARFPDGSVARLPRRALRTRLGPVHEDATYVFGARTPLVLGWRRGGCAVRDALDRQLERSAPPRRLRTALDIRTA